MPERDYRGWPLAVPVVVRPGSAWPGWDEREAFLGLRYASNWVDARQGDVLTVTAHGWFSHLLPDVIAKVLAGEEITLTRHGRAVAVVVRPDRLRTRRAQQALGTADRLREAVERGRRIPLSAAPGVSAERAEELVGDVRASRRAR